MIKQDWMVIIAGNDLVEAMSAETKARCTHTGYGYASEQLCALQREQAGRGIIGVEVVCSMYGHSVRYDSGLQNFGLLAGSRNKELDGTLADAERYATEWVAKDPTRRYAWRRKTDAERGSRAKH
jgi:hypothetical protein